MCLVLGCPAVDEEAYGDDDTPRKHEGDAELRSSFSLAERGFEVPVYPVVERRAELGTCPEAQAEGDVVQPGDAERFVVSPCEQEGKGGEDEIHQAVEEGHVEG